MGEQITFALLMLFAAPFVAGYAVTRPRSRPASGSSSTAGRRSSPAWTGAAAGLVFGAAAVFVEWFGVDRIRSVFLNVTEELIEFVTFGLPPVAGALVLTALSALVGGLGAGSAHPEHVRKPVRRPRRASSSWASSSGSSRSRSTN